MNGASSRSMRFAVAAALAPVFLAACSAPADRASAPLPQPAAVVPVAVYGGMQAPVGEPTALALDFNGRVVVADGSPGRLLRFRTPAEAIEFQSPSGLYASAVAVSGFFVYAVDEPARRVVRFDDRGAYRDVLLNFEADPRGRRVSPYGLAVDGSGRVAVTDIENHQVLLYNSFLQLEVVFGNYGTYEGQLSAPRGVSFTADGDIVVADTGNRRIQLFSDGGAFVRAVPPPGAPNPLRRPRRVVDDEDGRLLVADPLAGAVFVFTADGRDVRVLVADGVPGFAPTDVAVSSAGQLYVADDASGGVLVFDPVFEGF